MIILGIDPGTATTGYGAVKISKKEIKVIDFGLVETDKNGKPGNRLICINKKVNSLLKNLQPDVVAMEKLFFATNAKTAMNVGRAMGVIAYTAARAKVEIFEYAPGTIKKVITGDGRADKKIVQKSVRKILGPKVRSKVRKKTHFDNCADALAVALCHAYNIRKGLRLGEPQARRGGD